MPKILKFLLMMTGMFNYLLMAGLVLALIAYLITTDKSDKTNLYLVCVLIVIIVVTAGFNYY